MDKLKQCAGCRYCRVNAFIKFSAVMLAGAVAAIVLMFENGAF